MRGNRSRDTLPELAIRKRLHKRGLRYRVDLRPEKDVNRRADIVFAKARVAIFIDGCFWHGCPQHYVASKSNVAYWAPKIARNVERDRETSTALSARGWMVLRYWEHEDPADVASAIERAVRERLAV
jgi:DNA mismatch endonuclease (patch repair protein)